MKTLIVLMSLLAVQLAHGVTCETPSSAVAWSGQYCEWEIGARDDGWKAPGESGYTVEIFRQTTPPDLDPEFFLENYLYWLSMGAGYFHDTAHGSDNGKQIITFPHTEEGLAGAWWLHNWYESNGYAGLTYVSEAGTGANYAVAVKYTGLTSSLVTLKRAFGMNDCCYGGNGPAWAAYNHGDCAVLYGPLGECTVTHSYQNVVAMCGGLRGEFGISRRNSHTAFGYMPDAVENVGIAMGQYTTLAPAIERMTINGYPWKEGQTINNQDAEIIIQTDTKVSWEEGFFWALESYMSASATVLSNTRIQVNLTPIQSNVRGLDEFRLNAWYVPSATCWDICLAGTGKTAPEDAPFEFLFDDSPAACIEDFHVSENMASWNVLWEKDTDHYNLYGRNSGTEAYQLIGTSPASVGKHELPCIGFKDLTVHEVEKDGDVATIEYCRRQDVSNITIRGDHKSPQEVIDWVKETNRQGMTPEMATKMTKMGRNGDVAVFYWGGPSYEPASEAVSFCTNFLGMTVSLVDASSFREPGMSDSAWACAIKADLHDRWLADGVKWCVLFGDGSEAEYFLDASYWPYPWDNTRNTMLSQGFTGDPENNHLPFVMERDPAPGWLNRMQVRPYWFINDMVGYGDLAGDLGPEVYVGRIPMETEDEYWNVVAGFMQQMLCGRSWPISKVTTYCEDRNFGDPGEGDHAVAAMYQISAAFGGYNQVIFNSAIPWGEELETHLYHWNHDVPEVVLFVGSDSDGRQPANCLSQYDGFLTSMITTPWRPSVWGQSCVIGAAFMSKHPSYGNYWFHRMMGDDMTYGISTLFSIGGGSWQIENRELGAATAAATAQNPSRGIGESIGIAAQGIVDLHSQVFDQAWKTSSFFGFPFQPLLLKPVVVGVDNTDSSPKLWFARPFPNPASGKSTINFSLSRSAHVSLSIYDVSGRLVRTLIDGTQESGLHSVMWDGRTNSGQQAGSGIYLYRFNAQNLEQNGRIIRLR